MDPETFDPDGRFRAAVAASLAADPMPTFTELARNLGVAVDDVVHYALHRWAAAGSWPTSPTRQTRAIWNGYAASSRSCSPGSPEGTGEA